MKRKILFSLLLIGVCFVMIGCRNKNEDIKSEWIIDLTSNQQMLDDEVLSAFEKAKEEHNGTLEYVALLGQQVVAGMNYMFLVKDDNGYQIAVIYSSFDGTSQITHLTKFDLLKYVNKNIEVNLEQLSGGWYTEIPGKLMAIDENVQNYFDESTEMLTGASYFPIAVLGHQEKSGTNYAILCYSVGSYLDSLKGVSLLTIHVDASNKSEILSIADVDLKEYNN